MKDFNDLSHLFQKVQNCHGFHYYTWGQHGCLVMVFDEEREQDDYLVDRGN